MKTVVIAAILSATAAFAAATWIYVPAADEPLAAPSTSFDATLSANHRIAALELAVSQERMARQLLQDEILYLTDELSGLLLTAEPETEAVREEQTGEQAEMTGESRRERYARGNSPEGRTERLIEAGIEPGLASWIVQREQELQMETLQARFAAEQSGDTADFYRDQRSTRSALREELGDIDYERYLAANGRSTSVGIGSVIGSSPAQTAGLRPGDEIVRYDGERVFTMTDINNVSMDGIAGQNIVVDITRDGIPMQLVLPRGPLGITSRRTRR